MLVTNTNKQTIVCMKIGQHLINSYNIFKQIISCTPVNNFDLTVVLSK